MAADYGAPGQSIDIAIDHFNSLVDSATPDGAAKINATLANLDALKKAGVTELPIPNLFADDVNERIKVMADAIAPEAPAVLPSGSATTEPPIMSPATEEGVRAAVAPLRAMLAERAAADAGIVPPAILSAGLAASGMAAMTAEPIVPVAAPVVASAPTAAPIAPSVGGDDGFSIPPVPPAAPAASAPPSIGEILAGIPPLDAPAVADPATTVIPPAPIVPSAEEIRVEAARPAGPEIRVGALGADEPDVEEELRRGREDAAAAAAAAPPAPTVAKDPQPFGLFARMAGAYELDRIAPDRYVEETANSIDAFFKPSRAQLEAARGTDVQRVVSFLPAENQLRTSPGINIQEAIYIVAVGTEAWGGVKLLRGSTASSDDKLKLFIAAETHKLRHLVIKLQDAGSDPAKFTDADRLALAKHIQGIEKLPSVKFEDGTAPDGGTYTPPATITSVGADGRPAEVSVRDHINGELNRLAQAALAIEPTLSTMTVPTTGIALAELGSTATPAPMPRRAPGVPSSRDAAALRRSATGRRPAGDTGLRADTGTPAVAPGTPVLRADPAARIAPGTVVRRRRGPGPSGTP